jgi:hypothetical protein
MITPVVDPKTKQVILYDLWVNGCWAGSRRTIPQAIQELKNQNWQSWIIAGDDYHIEYGSPHRIIFDDV